MANKTLEQRIKDLEAVGEQLIMEVEEAGAGLAVSTWAAMNFTQSIMWLKKGIE
jgi:hypothetical protein